MNRDEIEPDVPRGLLLVDDIHLRRFQAYFDHLPAILDRWIFILWCCRLRMNVIAPNKGDKIKTSI